MSLCYYIIIRSKDKYFTFNKKKNECNQFIQTEGNKYKNKCSRIENLFLFADSVEKIKFLDPEYIC